MNPLAEAISAALLHSLWQDSMVAVLLWVALVALRRHPHARYAAGCTALALMAVLPFLTTALLYLDARGPDALSPAIGTASAILEDADATAGWIGNSLQQVAWVAGLQPWTLPAWSIGVLLFSLRLLGGGAHAIALKRHGEPADAGIRAIVARIASRMGVEQPVRVAISARTTGPATLGWLRPVILLPPATVLGLTPQQLEMVLAHELAHIRRHDYLVNVSQMVVETLWFYHPAVWWVSNRIRIDRELCCDDLAVGSSGDALCYAQALTKIARLRVTAPGMAVGAASGPLVHRIERLLAGRTTPESRSHWPALIALSLVLASGALNVTWMRAHAQANDATGFYSGLWEIRPASTAGPVQLRLCYADLFSRAELPVDQLDAFSQTRLAGADGPIQFTVRRDAGTFSLKGNVLGRAGAGTYTFAPAAGFSQNLERRGFERPTTSLLHTLALHDLGLAFVDELWAQGVSYSDMSHIVRSAQIRSELAALGGFDADGRPTRFPPERVRTSGWC